jgi:diamine N-acetyltransferase
MMETENQEIITRNCNAKDLEELVKISRTTYYDTFISTNSAEDMEIYLQNCMSEEVLLKELSNPDSFFYFAEYNGQPVGYLKVNRGEAQIEKFKSNTIELERLYVVKEFLGKGVANQLLQIAIDFAKGENAEFLWLGVWEHNYRARRFYEKHGFVKFGEHNFIMGTDVQIDWMMKLDLSKTQTSSINDEKSQKG